MNEKAQVVVSPVVNGAELLVLFRGKGDSPAVLDSESMVVSLDESPLT